MRAYLQIIRPLNCIMAALAVWVAMLISGAATPTLYGWLTIIAAFLICGAGMVVNDYFDIAIDRVNKPQRPLPSGRMSPKIALIYAAALFVIGIVMAFFVNQYVLMIAVLNSLIEVLYAWKLKGVMLVGNILVSYLVASLFIYGGLAIGNVSSIWILALLAFLSNMGREIYKSVEDVLGDRQHGVVSLATRFKIPAVKNTAAVFVLLAIVVSFMPYALLLFGLSYLAVVIVSDIIFIYAIVSPADKAAKLCKYAMLIALIAFIAGALL